MNFYKTSLRRTLVRLILCSTKRKEIKAEQHCFSIQKSSVKGRANISKKEVFIAKFFSSLQVNFVAADEKFSQPFIALSSIKIACSSTFSP
jgi:hypothetical protein